LVEVDTPANEEQPPPRKIVTVLPGFFTAPACWAALQTSEWIA